MSIFKKSQSDRMTEEYNLPVTLVVWKTSNYGFAPVDDPENWAYGVTYGAGYQIHSNSGFQSSGQALNAGREWLLKHGAHD